MKTLFANSDGILQSINTMEAAQQKAKRAKLVIQDEYMHAVALKLLLKSGEYETETREVSMKLKRGSDPKMMTDRREWYRKFMDDKGVTCNDNE